MEGEELPESREQEFIETDEDAQVRHRKPTNPAGEALSTRNFLRLALVGGAGVVAAGGAGGGDRPAIAACEGCVGAAHPYRQYERWQRKNNSGFFRTDGAWHGGCLRSLQSSLFRLHARGDCWVQFD